MKGREGIIVGAALILISAASFHIGRSCRAISPQSDLYAKADTLFIRDTITLSKPIYMISHYTDTVLMPVTDTVRMRDTVFVAMQREQLEWRDSLCTVYASGIRPRIDSVAHYVQERIIVREAPRPSRSIGVSVGPAAGFFLTPDGWTPGAGVAVQVGLCWNF